MPDRSSYIFEIVTPLGFSVHTTSSYWRLIEEKHPEIAGKQQAVQECLRSPDQIRQSKRDGKAYLFYRSRPPFHLCVVTKRLNESGFVVTCYLTDKIKEGEKVWPTSE